MAFNNFMHPRNIYKNRPNFKELADKYSEFKQFVTIDPTNNKVIIDFKNPNALRALTTVCLKNDFQLDVVIPEDRLIPTLPSRLNYILWIEDLLDMCVIDTNNITGIDIGTGACSIYPLLGSKKNNWKFLATEINPISAQSATSNIQRNNLDNNILVVQVGPNDPILPRSISNESRIYDFTMCNPPFYQSKSEMAAEMDDRPRPSSINTGADNETIVDGGEVGFVSQLIFESQAFKNKIRIFSSLLGKKCSLKILKDKLHEIGASNYTTTEFYQGNTMRWAIAWTFCDSLSLDKAKSTKGLMKKTKPKLPLKYDLPLFPGSTLPTVTEKILDLFKKLEMYFKIIKKAETLVIFNIVAEQNTWSHQRRKRRMRMKMETELQHIKEGLLEEVDEESENPQSTSFDSSNNQKRKYDSESDEDAIEQTKRVKVGVNEGEIDLETVDCVLACTVVIKLIKNKGYCIELQWTRGSLGREAMHQFLQYLKNSLVQFTFTTEDMECS